MAVKRITLRDLMAGTLELNQLNLASNISKHNRVTNETVSNLPKLELQRQVTNQESHLTEALENIFSCYTLAQNGGGQ